MEWQIKTEDVTNASPQSNIIDRAIYVQPSRDLNRQEFPIKLKEPLYGLDNNSLKWYQTVEKKNEGAGMYQTPDKIIRELLKEFYFGTMSEGSHKFLGWNISN